MENFTTLLCCKRKNSKLKQKWLEEMNMNNTSHEGIKTIGVRNSGEFSTIPVLRVCVVTWNMNGKESSQDIEELLGDQEFDLLVVGLQEVPRCNVAQLLQQALVETHSLLGESIMQSLQLFVFGLKNYELFIKDIQVDNYSVGGFGGLIGRKKGAVAISISFKGIRMDFISCHLSAHARNVEERNCELWGISHSLFSKNQNPYSKPSQITVWLGDLNYRIEGIDTLPVRNLIQNNLHRLLTSKDQLLQEAERGQIFNGYHEGTLAFKPTYKYDVGSNNYDTSHKVRVPSWTDRILFKIEKHGDIDAMLHSYESLDCIESSDHKPVKALLCLKINKEESPSSVLK
ncbi:hypothetical protein GIB67_017392 [Kingdonia uniflora]|uniref:Inositol polyphosphate-related phosphatase domain-containing protein n=1 Tax=Kingdonia uniflora TaxID=39325 RepID=A0A7J7M460_9MAGN|nr:hypothetical protein GIB67_017392 [Kingdonia uniflora]